MLDVATDVRLDGHGAPPSTLPPRGNSTSCIEPDLYPTGHFPRQSGPFDTARPIQSTQRQPTRSAACGAEAIDCNDELLLSVSSEDSALHSAPYVENGTPGGETIRSRPGPTTVNSPQASNDASMNNDRLRRIASSETEFNCWEHGCNGRSFATDSNLRRHQREYSSARPLHLCPMCGAFFSRSTARNQHVERNSCGTIRRYSNGRQRTW